MISKLKKISEYTSRFYSDIFQFRKKYIGFLKKKADRSKGHSLLDLKKIKVCCL